MLASRLKLEHYTIKSFRFDVNDQAESLQPGVYADFSSAKYSSSVSFQEINHDGLVNKFVVQLSLEAEPEEGKNFPCTFSITLMGFFDGAELEEEKRDALVAANGASVLYSAAREIILGMSHKSYKGAVLLPTVSFANVGENIMARKLGRPTLSEH